MSILVKAGGGLAAGVVAGILGLAFFPHVEPTALKPRRAVEKPQFVVAVPAADPDIVRAAATVAVASETPAAKPAPAAKPSPESRPAAAEAKPTPSAVAAPVVLTKLEPPKAPPVAETRAVASPQPAAAAPAAAAPATATDASARWSVPGLVALAKGDLSRARLFLARAADAGDPRAWVALADTYDPAMLTKLGVVVAPGDAQRARDYLVKAAAAGVVVKDRLAALESDAQNLR